MKHAARVLGPLSLLGVLGGCDAELYHGLSERQANRALVALRQAGFAANKHPEGQGTQSYKLTVPRAEETQALRLLDEQGLLRPSAARPPRPLLPLPEAERQQRALELGEQLAGTLEALPEVLEARVHLRLPAEDPLHPGEARAAASVLLRLRGPLPLGLGEVAQLVARAVPQLEPKEVTVLTAVAPVAPAAGPALVRVGPLWVAPASQRWANALLGTTGVLAAAVLWLLLRRRHVAAADAASKDEAAGTRP